jgi:hypothetical protein
MIETRRVNVSADGKTRFYCTEEMRRILDWDNKTELIGELSDTEMVIYQNPAIHMVRFHSSPNYNVFSFYPHKEIESRRARLIAEPGMLIVKYL